VGQCIVDQCSAARGGSHSLPALPWLSWQPPVGEPWCVLYCTGLCHTAALRGLGDVLRFLLGPDQLMLSALVEDEPVIADHFRGLGTADFTLGRRMDDGGRLALVDWAVFGGSVERCGTATLSQTALEEALLLSHADECTCGVAASSPRQI
jgi:hypothetical protein